MKKIIDFKERLAAQMKNLTLWLVLFSLILWSIGLPSLDLLPPAQAATFTLNTDGLLNDKAFDTSIATSSPSTAALKIIINGVAATTTLNSIRADLYNSIGFETSDLLPLSNASSSGATLYRESGTTPTTFDSSDVFIAPISPTWTATSSSSYVDLIPGSATYLYPALDNTFYLVIRTSASGTPGDKITAIIGANAISTGEGPGPSAPFYANTFMIDGQGPTVTKAELVNPSTVDVIFSERIQAAGAAMATSSYVFSGPAAGVLSVMAQGGNAIRVTTDSNLSTSTTVTVGGGIPDIAGNLSSPSTPVTITVSNKVKISEAALMIGGDPNSQFVELYNAGENEINIGNWRLEYSGSSPVSWTAIATVTPSTPLPSHKFYLFSTSQFDAVSPVDGDQNFSAVSTGGGHFRLVSDTSVEIDRLGWGGAVGPEGSPASPFSSNMSLERKAFGSSDASRLAAGGEDAGKGNGWDSDNNSSDFVSQYSPNAQNLSSPAETPEYGSGGGPMIDHLPVNYAPTGSSLEIIARMGDPANQTGLTAELHYMIGDGSPSNNTSDQYSIAPGAQITNGFYKFTIPQTIVDSSTSNGLYYYLKLLSSQTKLMSASPSADQSGLESAVAQNPFIVATQDPTGWPRHNITGTTSPAAFIFVGGTGYNTTASSSGAFTLPNVKDGIYNIVFAKTGYCENFFNNLYLNGVDYSVGSQTLASGDCGSFTGDTERPRVKWTAPSDGMNNVASNTRIFIGFSKDLASSTFVSANVYLTINGTTSIASDLEYYNSTSSRPVQYPTEQYLGVVRAPAGGFLPDTTYYLVVTGALRDSAGNSLDGNRSGGGHVIAFTTGANFTGSGYGQGAMRPPYVTGVNPADGSFNVAQNTKIVISFSDPMDMSTLLPANLKLESIALSGTDEIKTPLSPGIALDATQRIVTLTPAANLTANGKYRVTLTGALKSATGIWMGNPGLGQNTSSFEIYRSNFQAGTGADSQAPTVTGSWPVSLSQTTNIAVNPGPITIQFSESLDPSTVNANTVTLKRGSSPVTGSVFYDASSHAASFVPSAILAGEAAHTLRVAGGSGTSSSPVKDMAGNPLASDYSIVFTTSSSSDVLAPKIMYSSGNDFRLAITFSESMNAAKVTDSLNFPTSVLNRDNYLLKQGLFNSDFAAGYAAASPIDTSGARFNYDALTNTVSIENLTAATTTGNNYYIEMTSATVPGAGAADLAGNSLASTTQFQTPIASSYGTMGEMGPNFGGGGMTGPNMAVMGMMKAGAFPMNSTAGQNTVYFIDLPTAGAVGNGYKIVLTFPDGFDVSGAKKDPYSPVNRDINEWNAGTVTFATSTESSGGAGSDGVTVDTAARAVTITLSIYGGTPPTGDYLHLDLAGIVNSSIPRGFDTGGYSVDLKILKDNGALLESVAAMPFFITTGGALTLSGSITLASSTAATDGTLKLFLGSPFTGPTVETVTIADGSGNYSFSSLATGQYMLFTEPALNFPDSAWNGLGMPEAVNLTASTTKNLVFYKENAGSVLDLTVNLLGDFGGNDIDVFAGSPQGFRVKTLYGATSSLPAQHLFLPAGDWMVGVGPAMTKGVMSGPPPMPDWMPPMPQFIRSTGSGATSTTLTVVNASLQIIGEVRDSADAAIADAEVYAYQPGSTSGMGAHAKTDTAGRFTLKLAQTGNYTLGVYKPGLPFAPERGASVSSNTGAADGNSSADVTADGKLITAANKLIFKITKPDRTISGKVTNGSSPVAYAPVWADRLSASGHADTMTDASGNFILYTSDGAWRLNAYIPGFGNAESQTVVVAGNDVTQNLAPESGVNYYKISGSVTIDGQAQSYRPIRAAQFSAGGFYTGKEYHGQTDSSGNYSISVPGSNDYRVDIWTPEFGEVGLETDEVADSPANVTVAAVDRAGLDITIASGNLLNLTLEFANKSGYGGKEGFVNIDGVNCSGSVCKTNGFHKTLRLADVSGASQSVKLRASSTYYFMFDLPGTGGFLPAVNADTGRDPVTGAVLATTTPRIVSFSLPNAASTTAVISGTVVEGAASSSGAWVWLANPSTGYKTGTKTAADGSYALTAPLANGYRLGADKPGFVAGDAAAFDLVADITRDFTLTAKAAGRTVSGKLYRDANTNSAYDLGEEIADGLVRAKSTDGTKVYSAPADGSGAYELGLPAGTWLLYGLAEGYSASAYNSSGVAVSGADIANINIKLTVDSSWANKSKKVPITPAAGGTMDDTAASSTGIKLTVPPNALGNSAAAGNLAAAVTGAINKTNSSESFNSLGISVSASDNTGQAINNLNDYIDMEMVLYKADVDAAVIRQATTSSAVYGWLKKTTNGYWDQTAGDWITLPTARAAYFKNSGDTEWKAASSTFDEFIDSLPGSYADYKLVYTSKTNHLTIFAVIMPFVAIPAQAQQENQQNNNNGGGGGGGSSSGQSCLTVVYDEWQNACVNNLQFRNVKYQGPDGCLLTIAQENQRKRSCGEVATTTPKAEEKKPVTTAAKAAVKKAAAKANKYLGEARTLVKSSIKVFLAKMKLKMSAYRVNLYTRLYLRGIVKNVKGLKEKDKTIMIRFITYGSDSTKKMSAKQRANVLNTYKKITGKLPVTEKEWSDAIWLAVGKR